MPATPGLAGPGVAPVGRLGAAAFAASHPVSRNTYLPTEMELGGWIPDITVWFYIANTAAALAALAAALTLRKAPRPA